MTVIMSTLDGEVGVPAWDDVGAGLQAIAWLPNGTPVVALEERLGMLRVLTPTGVFVVYKENVVEC
jgi:hypothetical protein